MQQRNLALPVLRYLRYMSKKRGYGAIELSSELDAMIDRWALAVVTGESDINLCDVCQCALKKF